ncbi:hypothetical protein BGZ94_005113 [Podila epigama]|nr:hypothetical protein BGZ94_005113 [Podila epigama]
MKSIATLAIALSSAILVSADMLQIHNPTVGSVWKTGTPSYLGWSGSCASMGAEGQKVNVDLMTGPSDLLRYVTTVGTIDCTGSVTRADITVPMEVESGKYSLAVRTTPALSYSNIFTIVGAGSATPPSSPPTNEDRPNAPSADNGGGSTKNNAGSSLRAGSIAVTLGAAIAAVYLF